MSPKKSQNQSLRYVLYFTFPEIEKLLVPDKTRRDVINYFKPVKAVKAYFEVNFLDKIPNMKAIIADFERAGVQGAGALLPAYKGAFCYNNLEHMKMLEKRVRDLAGLFDEIIIDDWLFTVCTCAKCVKGRGAKEWGRYRCDLMTRRIPEHIQGPARKVNPRVKIIVKFPNWYEGHYANGYDVPVRIRQFDGFCTGIETRNTETHHQHIPHYSAFAFQKWYSRVDSKKNRSVWLDNWGMKGHEGDYLAQYNQGILAGAREIVIWSGGHHYKTGPWGSVYKPLTKALSGFERTAALLDREGKPGAGVPVYMPFASTAEYNLFGYLGMAGIPLEPVIEFPLESAMVILTAQAAKDPGLAGKILDRLRRGKDVFMTYALYKSLAKSEIGKFLQVIGSEGSVSADTFLFPKPGKWDAANKTSRPVSFPRLQLTTWPYVRTVAAMREDGDFPVLVSARYLNATVHVLNVPENPHDLYRLPDGALEAIRQAAAGDLGISLLGTGKVALYPFGKGLVVIENMNPRAVKTGIRIKSPGGWRPVFGAKSLKTKTEKDRVDVTFSLAPFGLAALRAE